MPIPTGGPFSREAVVNAPFSANARTSVRVQLPDGSGRDYTVTARYYRDSQGRVREHVPFYVLDPVTRTYRIGPGYSAVAKVFNGEGRVALPVKTEDPIRSRFCFQIAPPVIAGASYSERLEAVAAQVAPDLGIVIASHRSDAIASVDYQVTNIRRGEPSADLFDVLTTYTLVNEPVFAVSPWQLPPACKPIEK